MNFTYVLSLLLITFALSTSLLYYVAEWRPDQADLAVHAERDGAALCALYDLFWVLFSLGTLLLLFLAAANQVLRGLEFDAKIQRENESLIYRELLLKTPLTDVCSEPIVLKPGENLVSKSRARDEACIWAKDTTLTAKKLQTQKMTIDTICMNDDLIAFGRPTSASNVTPCGLSRVNPCAREMCEYDKTLHEITGQRVTNPMPIGFDSAIFHTFSEKLKEHAPKVSLDSSIYKSLKPIEAGVFAVMWVWACAVALGFRLAKGWFEVHSKWRKARESEFSWCRIQPMNWKPRKNSRKKQ